MLMLKWGLIEWTCVHSVQLCLDASSGRQLRILLCHLSRWSDAAAHWSSELTHKTCKSHRRVRAPPSLLWCWKGIGEFAGKTWFKLQLAFKFQVKFSAIQTVVVGCCVFCCCCCCCCKFSVVVGLLLLSLRLFIYSNAIKIVIFFRQILLTFELISSRLCACVELIVAAAAAHRAGRREVAKACEMKWKQAKEEAERISWETCEKKTRLEVPMKTRKKTEKKERKKKKFSFAFLAFGWLLNLFIHSSTRAGLCELPRCPTMIQSIRWNSWAREIWFCRCRLGWMAGVICYDVGWRVRERCCWGSRKIEWRKIFIIVVWASVVLMRIHCQVRSDTENSILRLLSLLSLLLLFRHNSIPQTSTTAADNSSGDMSSLVAARWGVSDKGTRKKVNYSTE